MDEGKTFQTIIISANNTKGVINFENHKFASPNHIMDHGDKGEKLMGNFTMNDRCR